MESLTGSDILAFAFGIPLLMYWLWFIYSLEKFRSRSGKRKGVLRSELRRIRLQATVAAFAIPTYLWLLNWIISVLFGKQPPTGETLLFLQICGSGFWLFHMSAIWSFISGFRVIESEGE